MYNSKESSDQWSAMLKKVFPTGIPAKCTWTSASEIANTLNVLAKKAPSNILFYPNYGWDTIRSASASSVNGFIELNCGFYEMMLPKSLTFSKHPNTDWCFFFLETVDNSSSVIDMPSTEFYKMIAQLPSGEFVPRDINNENPDTGESIPYKAKFIRKFKKGSFVIFNKYSEYGQNKFTTDARHNLMNVESFSDYILTASETGLEKYVFV